MLLSVSAGIPERTLLRAKSELRVQSRQVHFEVGGHEWYWYDPAAPWPKNAPFRKPYELPPLPELGDLLEEKYGPVLRKPKKRPATDS